MSYTYKQTSEIVDRLIFELVKHDGYPYATGFIKVSLARLLAGKTTVEQEIELFTKYIKGSEAING